jgi:hypothetical protein
VLDVVGGYGGMVVVVLFGGGLSLGDRVVLIYLVLTAARVACLDAFSEVGFVPQVRWFK